MAKAVEGAHMGHPDFRVNNRIFATLYPDGRHGMVKLTPDQQQEFLRSNPAMFTPASGAWGRQGCTTVRLDSADEDTLGEAMTLAWQATATMGTARRSSAGATRKPARRTRKR